MLIIIFGALIGFLGLFVAIYAVAIFLEALANDARKSYTHITNLQKENELLRFEKKRMQLIINQLESEKNTLSYTNEVVL